MKNAICFLISSCMFLMPLFGPLVYAQSPAQRTPGEIPQYAPDRVLVAFEPGTPGAEKKALHGKVGGSLLKTIPGLDVDIVRVSPNTVLEKVDLYDKNPNVRYAEPDYYRVFWMPKEGAEPFSGNMFDQQWALNNTAQTMAYCDSFLGCSLDWGYVKGTSGADIDAPQAWEIGRSYPEIKIAILDSGIDSTSIDLDTKIIDSRNYVQSYENTLEDMVGHGTHVAGIAAAKCNNSQGIAGVACNASLVSLKVCYYYENPDNIFDPLNGAGVCPASAVAEAIADTADPNGDGSTDDHFNVVNMSFGTDIVVNGVWSRLQGYSATEEAAINKAFNAGVVLVAAAGNDGSQDKSYPAAYANVIAVGATDEDDNKATFSNYGKDWVSVGAPGNYIWSVLPNAQCPTLTPPYQEACLWPLSGTSMASPHVAGAAGVVLGYLQDQYKLGRLTSPPTNSQVRCHIEQGANRIGVQGLDYSVLYFKYGRLNLAGALQHIDVCDGTGNTMPAAPSALTASSSYAGSGKKRTFNGVYLRWTNNTTNVSNSIERCDNVSVGGTKRQRTYTCAGAWHSLVTVGPGVSTYLDGVPSTTTSRAYLYRANASNSVGSSSWSNEAGITTPAQ